MGNLIALLLAFLATSFILAACLKIYWKLSTKWNGSYKCLVGKTAIVTGANTGMYLLVLKTLLPLYFNLFNYLLFCIIILVTFT